MKNKKFDFEEITVSVQLRYMNEKDAPDNGLPAGMNFTCTLSGLNDLLNEIADIKAPLEFWFTVSYDSRKKAHKFIPAKDLIIN